MFPDLRVHLCTNRTAEMKANLLKLLFTAVLFLQAGRIATAQIAFKDLTFTARYLPGSSYVPPGDSVDRSGQTTQKDLALHGNITLGQSVDQATGKVRMWTGTFGAMLTSMHHKDYEISLLPETLLGTYAGVQHYRTLNPRWGLTVFAQAGLYSDLEKIDGNDLFVTAGVLGIRHFSEQLNLGVGVIVHNSFGTPMVWPALTVNWKMGGRLKLDVRVPDNGPGLAYKIGVQYQFRPELGLEFSFKPGCMTYDVEKYAESGRRLMSFWQLPLGLELKWEKEHLRLFGGGGLMALRSYSFGEKKLSKMFSEYPYYGIGTQMFLQAGVQWKF